MFTKIKWVFFFFFVILLLLSSNEQTLDDIEKCKFRRVIEIYNPELYSIDNIHIVIDFNTKDLIQNMKMKVDCSDIKPVFANNKSKTVEFWLEGKCGLKHTKIWFKIPFCDAQSSVIFYVYYGSDDTLISTEEIWNENFLVLSTASCPSGWNRYGHMDGYFGFAIDNDGSLGGTLVDEDNLQHNHRIFGKTGDAIGTFDVCDSDGNSWNPPKSTHIHTFNFVSDDETITYPPYHNMIICYASKMEFWLNSVHMLDTSTIPGYFSRFSALDEKFFMGSITSSIGSGSEEHSHNVTSKNVDSCCSSSTLYWNCDSDLQETVAIQHTHDVDGQIATSSHLPPYCEVVFIINDVFSEDVVILESMRVMAVGIPPLGYVRDTLFDQRLIRGSPSGLGFGAQAGSFFHSHVPDVLDVKSSNGNQGIQSKTHHKTCTPTHDHSMSTANVSLTRTNPPYNELFVLKQITSSIQITNDYEESNSLCSPPCTQHGECQDESCICDNGLGRTC